MNVYLVYLVYFIGFVASKQNVNLAQNGSNRRKKQSWPPIDIWIHIYWVLQLVELELEVVESLRRNGTCWIRLIGDWWFQRAEFKC